MTWYTAPLGADATIVAPDTRPAGVTLQAPGSGAVLVGVRSALSPLPAGWSALTLAEAQAQFTAVMGRAPSATEVY